MDINFNAFESEVVVQAWPDMLSFNKALSFLELKWLTDPRQH